MLQETEMDVAHGSGFAALPATLALQAVSEVVNLIDSLFALA